jgi:Spy/CpxP family protein refolding chaperone
MRWLFAILLACALITPIVVAAHEGEGAPADERDERTKRFEERRRRVLRERVGLTDDKAERVEAVFARMQAERRRLQSEAKSARQELRTLLDSDSEDQKAYGEALARLERAHKALAEVRYKYFAEVKTILTPKEQAKLLKALNQVKKAMRTTKKGNKGKGKGRGKAKGK